MAIALAAEIKADAVLLDERAGRRVAELLGLTALGTVGILVQAKRSGHVMNIAPILVSLARDANFYLDPATKDSALRLAGEIP